MAPTVSPIARFLMRVVFSCYRSVRLIVLRLTSPTDERAARAVVSGAAWDEFCDTLKAAGASLVAPGAPTDAFNQAEGYRYLARLTRAGLENFLECADPEAPRLCAIANGDRPAPVKLGSDNPDNLYENATIDGRLEYVVSGTRGTVSYLGLGTQSGSYGGKGGLATVDYVEAEALTYDDAARTRFTLVLSAVRPEGAVNWLELRPDPPEAMFIVRQTFALRSQETPAALTIARRAPTGGAAAVAAVAPAPLTPAKLEAALQSTGLLVAGASAMFAKWAHGFQGHANALPLFDQARFA